MPDPAREPEPSTLLRWTGRGSLKALGESVHRILSLYHRGVRVTTVGKTLSVTGVEPAEAAARLRYLPGVEWIALGYSSKDRASVPGSVAILAKRYLRRGSTFKVEAESFLGRASASDLVGGVNSRVLDAVRGSRVNERASDVTFRVALDREIGAAGVEIRRGVGGVASPATGRAWCLVSGGMHSSVVAWMASVSGFAIELVHARVSDESVMEAARLYSELSNRMDPSYLRMTILTGSGGATPAEVVSAWLGRAGNHHVFTGIHAQCKRRYKRAEVIPGLLAPMLLTPEERFESDYKSLGLKGYFRDCDVLSRVSTPRRLRLLKKTFGGERADLHRVLDSLVS